MPFYKKTVKAGDILEIEYYKAIRKRRQPTERSINRSINRSLSSEKQKVLNEINLKKHFQQLIHSNFSYRAGDLYITLTYDKKLYSNMTIEIAENELINFIRRLQYYRKKHNLPPIKYVAVTETTKKHVTFHHHLIINSIDMNVLNDLWTKGRVDISRLDRNPDYTGLANYLTKETQYKCKSYTQSRNLKQPTITVIPVKRLKHTATASPPKGYILLDSKVYASDITGVMMYAKYIRINI